MTHEHPMVKLSVPNDARYASAVRMLASALAADVGLNVDEIEDLRLGITEMVSVLASAPATEPTTLEIAFALADERVNVAARRSDALGADEMDDLARQILLAVADDFVVDGSEIRMTKSTARRVGHGA
jgi:serine/threonine-protein kinase RsbW